MQLTFWGVRGSIPIPGPQTVKYGGNTVCLELQFNETGRRIIIDAGSGIRLLGNRLLQSGCGAHPVRADVLLTHTHLDHIMGLPFFAPLYFPQSRLTIYGPVTCEEEPLEIVLGTQLSYRYFPVRQAELSAEITYINLKEGTYDLGDGIEMTTKYLNHPLLCFGYRLQYRGKIFCTAYDTEPFRNVFITDPDHPAYDESVACEGELAAQAENSRLEDFIRGADFLVYDAQYTQQEYETGKIGWGHTAIEHAIETAKRCQVATLALLHHDPMRTDAQLDELGEKFCRPDSNADTEVFFAREKMELSI